MGNCLGQSADSNNLNQPSGNLQNQSKTVSKGQLLKRDKLKWKSDIPLTTFHITSKRDEFWDTAPAFEGRQEIWDALKAAVEATERNDYELAQAIIDGANIILPAGSLRDCYDELGNRYQLPLYVLTYPSNLATNSPKDSSNNFPQKRSKSKTHSKCKSPSKTFGLLSDISKQSDQLTTKKVDKTNSKITLNLRLSTGKDFKILADPDQTIENVKDQFAAICGFMKSRQRWYCYGKLLENSQFLSECTIPPNFIIQVIVHNPGENNHDLIQQ